MGYKHSSGMSFLVFHPNMGGSPMARESSQHVAIISDISLYVRLGPYLNGIRMLRYLKQKSILLPAYYGFDKN